MSILEKIVLEKRKELKRQKNLIDEKTMRDNAAKIERVPYDFKEALLNEEISIIAEIKKASPSKGIIREVFDPVAIAKEYMNAGVNAVSILTEKHFFKGSTAYIQSTRPYLDVPILRKDFIIDMYQIDEAYAIGADALLLIASLLEQDILEEFIQHARTYGLQALVEVHNERELEKALYAKAEIIGINNRNLNTFSTSLDVTKQLFNKIPRDKVVISESGIHSYQDMQTLRRVGVDGVLIGEVLMKSDEIKKTLRGLKYGEV